MTQKTTLPGIFTGPLVDSLPKFVHSEPVPSGLVRRYVASTIGPSQVGSPVATLPDTTGKGAPLAQATAALQPTLRQSGAIRYLQFAGSGMRGDVSNGVAYAVVARMRSLPTTGNHTIAQLGTWGGAGLSVNSGGNLISWGTAGLNTTLKPGSGWHVFYASFVGPTSVIQMGTQSVTGNAGTPPVGITTALGEDTGGNLISPVDIAEVLIWNRELTATERNKVVADLSANYGI